MLSINVSHAKPFLSYPYEEVLCPRLERAQRELLNGGGKGDDFIGWVRLPAQYDRAEYARILAAAKKIQGDSKVYSFFRHEPMALKSSATSSASRTTMSSGVWVLTAKGRRSMGMRELVRKFAT